MSALLLFYRKLTLKIAETFAPKKEPVDAVKLWLEEHGITEDRISISKSLSWVRFESTVGEAEKLLQTKYKVSAATLSRSNILKLDRFMNTQKPRNHTLLVMSTAFQLILRNTSTLSLQLLVSTHFSPRQRVTPPSGAEVDSTKPRTGVVAGPPRPFPNDGP